MIEISLEEFIEKYSPLRQEEVDLSFTIDPRIDQYILSLHNKQIAKISFEKIKHKYEMYVWTVSSEGSNTFILSRMRIAQAIGYIITENNHNIEEDIIIKLNMENKEKTNETNGTLNVPANTNTYQQPDQINSNADWNDGHLRKEDSGDSLDNVKEFMTTFKQPVLLVPGTPSKDVMILRASLSLEELYERVQASGIEGSFALLMIKVLRKIIKKYSMVDAIALKPLEEFLKEENHVLDTNMVDLVAILDAFLDERYVNDGAVHAYGMGSIFHYGFRNVHESNMTKACNTEDEAKETLEFHKAEHGDCYYEESNGKYLVYRSSDKKVMKSKYYTPTNLRKFIFLAER